MSGARVENQASWRPTAKVLAAWATGGGATIVTAVLVLVTNSVDPETFWGALAASVAAGAAAWLKRSRAVPGGTEEA
jgi:hypothetical protein